MGGNKFKFDVVIGNPPYQEETAQKKSKNGQVTRTNIFQKFQEQADKITKEQVSLIYPGARWLHRSGKGMKQFGLSQINDSHLKRIIFYPDATQVFQNVDITDGVTIVEKDLTCNNEKFEYEYVDGVVDKKILLSHPGEKLIPLNPDFISITNKINEVVRSKKYGWLSDSIYPRNLFGIESEFVEKNQDKVVPYNDGQAIDSTMKVKLLTNGKSGSAGRAEWFIVDRSIISKNNKLINKYKVIVSSAHPGGQNNRDNQLRVVDNESTFGRSRVALKLFNSKDEAVNFYNYMKSNFIRFTLLLTDEKLTSFAKWTPDLMNYVNSGNIDFSSKNIDNSLYKLFNLTDSDINMVIQTVKGSETKGGEK
ncbi:hypothetical protein AKUH3B110M_10190 [Apilactobacillus kunkeei]|uniref:Eco57I restriction-modification methylase domain-containing protein n=1 Tax=Apilactobacillus kunkeei TaxID=148814 RepID=UPI00200B6002|nr:Eco57I restriction-modification methylase domain-containing protein [Apilactobacillus kunkeei]MCK8633741.1 Eco57I restriction-modification methylase domain-containing protein [Apilactobacillus kunkeei]CAI2621758.1 hypothetical protein AKUG0804_10240 [Apilactobacillus kunkeei]CAI2621807.1 hypothetical protein AKUH3B207X_10200 [Apilactobacillus kunkeei]CAI2622503.1 hypothetical protein AKUG0101_10310 [Apilactobacillus kunkeei]CAI2622691.1 hypothetical protein AKUG0401_10240 [Apilactobacillus 